jgi:hypothetical protein
MGTVKSKAIAIITGRLSRPFQKHLDYIPGKQSSVGDGLLGTARIMMKISTQNFINFKFIFEKLLCNEPQGQGLTLAHG